VGGQPLRDTAILRWAGEVVDSVLLGSVATAAAVGTR
jgi:transcription-repair coupling factor (superfamily II helicase)